MRMFMVGDKKDLRYGWYSENAVLCATGIDHASRHPSVIMDGDQRGYRIVWWVICVYGQRYGLHHIHYRLHNLHHLGFGHLEQLALFVIIL